MIKVCMNLKKYCNDTESLEILFLTSMKNIFNFHILITVIELSFFTKHDRKIGDKRVQIFGTIRLCQSVLHSLKWN